MLVQHLLQAAVEGRRRCEAVVEHRAQGVDVTADVEVGIGDDLLRRHVERAADDGAFHGQHGPGRLGRAGDAEVRQLSLSGLIDKDVGWFYVTMDQMYAMGFSQTVSRLVGDSQGQPFWQAAAALDQVLEVAAIDELQHHERGAILGLAAIQAAHHVGVPELHGDAGFTFEAAHELSGLRRIDADRQVLLHGLDHDQLVLGRAGQPHRAHAAFGQVGEGDIGPQGPDVRLGDAGQQLIGEIRRQAVARGQPSPQIVKIVDVLLLGVLAQAQTGASRQQSPLACDLNQGVDNDLLIHSSSNAQWRFTVGSRWRGDLNGASALWRMRSGLAPGCHR